MSLLSKEFSVAAAVTDPEVQRKLFYLVLSNSDAVASSFERPVASTASSSRRGSGDAVADALIALSIDDRRGSGHRMAGVCCVLRGSKGSPLNNECITLYPEVHGPIGIRRRMS